MTNEEKLQILTRQRKIRNFSIVAHIDHGKSTLADRILEICNSVSKREMKNQLLDSMELERERGITIKLNAVQLDYKALDGNDYIFDLIDTPGHVDFSYEVSRSLAACEGAILVVDATQGIQAQTLANVYLALDNNLMVLPLINKVDLPSAHPDEVKAEIEDTIGLPCDDCVLASAKTGVGVRDILEQIVSYVPAPTGDPFGKLRALIFDSAYDPFRGVVLLFKVEEGMIHVGDKIHLMQSGYDYQITELGIRTPNEQKRDYLIAGEVGYLCAAIKNIDTVRVGDTITMSEDPADEPLPGYKKMNPMVYCGLYPIDSKQYPTLKEALEKLKLEDASLIYEAESSQALGFGFRTGFLGLLHMDIIEERLEREFGIDIIATAPSVEYHVYLTNGEMKVLDNPCELPDPSYIDHIEEPYVHATIMVPSEYVGSVMDLCQSKRGSFVDLKYVEETRAIIHYEMPLLEIVYDFFDKLKSQTRGYASLDYEIGDYKESKLVKMDIMLNKDIVDALSTIVHKDFAYERGKEIVEKLKTLIPRHQFEIPVQAVINHKVIARSDIKAVRKDVLAKCYGGDISRKKKLLEKQKAGKKRMKAIGSVEVPPEAFLAILESDENERNKE
ncbi:MAG: translation elongation factor 4 [Acholeplasmatales bacterium]|nr:translation elongation factor 4 [Acholeplasmatales bacterium]